jgi:hypothetical protein
MHVQSPASSASTLSVQTVVMIGLNQANLIAHAYLVGMLLSFMSRSRVSAAILFDSLFGSMRERPGQWS